MKKLINILVGLLLPLSLFAQNSVRGTVKEAATGEPVIGASVMVQGTTTGTITDIDGTYVLSGVPAGATLVYDCIGFRTVSVPVNGRSVIDILLEEDSEFLDEVVVVGYSVMKRRDVLGAVSKVGGKELAKVPVSSVQQSLQGRIAGVNVSTETGAPGAGVSVRVRGTGSISSSNEPLYIVDGIPVEGALNTLAASDIDEITVLKDASSAAIYGSRATNGVVLITTKSGAGAKGAGRIFYNGQFSLASLSRKLDIMNAQQYMDFGVANGYQTREGFNNIWDGTTDTDWGSEVFVPTWSQKHTVGFQGGNDNGNLFVSINDVDNNGIFKGDKDVYKRLSIQINADYKIKKWLTIGTNNSIEKWSTSSVSQQNDNGSAMLAAITSSPLFPVSCTYDALPTDVKNKASNHKILQDPDNPGMYWSLPTETQSSNPFVQRDATDSNSGGINVEPV